MKHSNRLKIFVVDDDLFFLNLMEQKISNLGYDNITLFQDGTSCLNKIQEEPDVVFLDYKLDTLNGYDVLKKIKRYDPNINVVMISGQDDIKAAIDTLKHGAFDYIQKGDSEDEKIEHVLQRIWEIKDILERTKPSFLKKVLQFMLM